MKPVCTHTYTHTMGHNHKTVSASRLTRRHGSRSLSKNALHRFPPYFVGLDNFISLLLQRKYCTSSNIFNNIKKDQVFTSAQCEGTKPALFSLDRFTARPGKSALVADQRPTEQHTGSHLILGGCGSESTTRGISTPGELCLSLC